MTLFEQLIAQQSKLLPSGTLTGSGGVALTLDGHGPTSAVLGGVTFSGAEGGHLDGLDRRIDVLPPCPVRLRLG